MTGENEKLIAGIAEALPPPSPFSSHSRWTRRGCIRNGGRRAGNVDSSRLVK